MVVTYCNKHLIMKLQNYTGPMQLSKTTKRPSGNLWLNDSHLVITMTSLWARWRLKSPATPLFTQPFIQTQIKENIKAPRHWPLCCVARNSPVTAQTASNAENVSIWRRHHVLKRRPTSTGLKVLQHPDAPGCLKRPTRTGKHQTTQLAC